MSVESEKCAKVVNNLKSWKNILKIHKTLKIASVSHTATNNTILKSSPPPVPLV